MTRDAPVSATARDAPAVTHEVRIDRARRVVTKRFRSWDRGEADREWRALCLLAEYAPGLAAEPRRAWLDASPPAIEMSWLPGQPLGGGPLPAGQSGALALALDRLWGSVPATRHGGPGAPVPNPVVLTGMVRAWVRDAAPACGQPDVDPLAQQAYAAGAAWLGRGDLDRMLDLFRRKETLRHAGAEVVLGQGDANLANFLWDGKRVRLVDFEDSGPSDRAFELAVLAEHISVWLYGVLDVEPFLGGFGLAGAEAARLREYRRLSALYWLIKLRPGSPASRRNPPGTLGRQADRLLALLG